MSEKEVGDHQNIQERYDGNMEGPKAPKSTSGLFLFLSLEVFDALPAFTLLVREGYPTPSSTRWPKTRCRTG